MPPRGQVAKGGRTPGRACQLIQFFSGIGEWERLLLGAFADCEAEFLEIPAFKAILFRALPGDVPRVKTCRHTFSPPEVAGIQRYVSPPARNTGTFPARMSLDSALSSFLIAFVPVCLPMVSLILSHRRTKGESDKFRHHGPASPTSGRGAQPERSGGAAAPPVDDERTAVQDFYQNAHFVCRIGPGHFPSAQGDPGAGPGMEADEEVAMSQDDSEREPVRRTRMNWAGSLRRELSQRAEQYARTHGLPHCLSYGHNPTVCFERYDDASRHGNFLPATYRAIFRNPNWRRRLQKVHSQGRKSLPRNEDGIRRELDACTSSDALLMNVFCYPGVFRDGRVCSMLDVGARTIPEFRISCACPAGQREIRPHRS